MIIIKIIIIIHLRASSALLSSSSPSRILSSQSSISAWINIFRCNRQHRWYHQHHPPHHHHCQPEACTAGPPTASALGLSPSADRTVGPRSSVSLPDYHHYQNRHNHPDQNHPNHPDQNYQNYQNHQNHVHLLPNKSSRLCLKLPSFPVEIEAHLRTIIGVIGIIISSSLDEHSLGWSSWSWSSYSSSWSWSSWPGS